ncbi:hypothetical protein [Microbispora sp. ATCC PTA-5024]|uniref:hypothetical protein n=1 Tax=Microbispora sp. ATCC PTA-5024 TaxID=316330 RepID=UPI0018DE2C2A|nr:hypothetical protein [Microbispora sp. ATCC PTA-5024]
MSIIDAFPHHVPSSGGLVSVGSSTGVEVSLGAGVGVDVGVGVGVADGACVGVRVAGADVLTVADGEAAGAADVAGVAGR